MRRHYGEVWAEEDQKLRQKLEAVKRTPTYRRLFNHHFDQYLSRLYGPGADLSTLRTAPEVLRQFAGEIEGPCYAKSPLRLIQKPRRPRCLIPLCR